jgi:hypothetical protein
MVDWPNEEEVIQISSVPVTQKSHSVAASDAVHSNQELIPNPGGGQYVYFYGYKITNDSTAAITVIFVEDTGGTPVSVVAKDYIPIGGGMVCMFPFPLKLSVDKNLGFSNTGQSNFGITVFYRLGE